MIGIRLGMTPGEVKPLLQGRKPLRVNEHRGALLYPSASGGQQQIPGSQYVRLVVGTIVGGDESVAVNFTPSAGSERAVSIERKQTFRPGQEPSHEATLSALTKKYGPFSFKRDPYNGTSIKYVWRFDAHGVLRDVTTKVDTSYKTDICLLPARAALDTPANKQDKQVLPDMLASMERCGATQVIAELGIVGNQADAQLVRTLEVHLGAWQEAVAARRSAEKRIEDYGRGAAHQSVREADQRRPEL